MHASEEILRSPDGRVELRFALADWCADGHRHASAPMWQVFFDGHPMLRSSLLGLAPQNAPALADGFCVESVTRSHCQRDENPGFPKDSAAFFSELVVKLREQSGLQRRLDLIFRCHASGVAACVRLPRQRGLAQTMLPDVRAVFRFPEDTLVWTAKDGRFESPPLEALKAPCAAPLTLNYAHGKMASLFVANDLTPTRDGLALVPAERADMVRTPWESPWLVLALADRPCALCACDAWLRECEVATPARTISESAVANCALPFLRMASESPMAFGPRATPAHRLAAAVIHANAGLEENEKMRFLRGEIGEFMVVAQKRGDVWQVAGITGAEGRVLTVRLEDFLPAENMNRKYRLQIQRDPLPNEPAGPDGEVTEFFDGVDRFDLPRLELPPGGGFLLRLAPDDSPTQNR
jgi:hypothetical protein